MVEEAPRSDRALLIYDGDCAFCRYCVDYARALNTGVLDFEPLQDAAVRYPEIPESEFRRAVFLIEAGGRTHAGAAATFRALALLRHPLAWWLYRWLPGFSRCAEAAYRFVAAHRRGALALSRALFGPELRPAGFARVSSVFTRLLGLIFLAAFASFYVQSEGLIGSEGIVPVADYLAFVQERRGHVPWSELPTLFWFASGDAAITALCIGGILCSLLLVAGIMRRTALLLLYAQYLSLVHAGQIFMQYQWDILLLETAVHAFLLLCVPFVGIWMLRWLLFRFMFEAGWAKLASGDETWRNLSALRHHFETQPLPTPLAWYAHHAPPWLLEFGTAAALGIELALPFLVFLPRRVRMLPLAGFVLLQTTILLSGNYNFFNLLTLVLCIALLDDRQLGAIIPGRFAACTIRAPQPAAWPLRAPALAACVAIGVISSVQIWHLTRREPVDGWQAALLTRAQPWFPANTYGLFAVMTTTRPQIRIEGSDDLEHWVPYETRYQPDDLQGGLGWNIPHQPRLDWQLWFAALRAPMVEPWFDNLAWRLLQGAAPVRALFAGDAFRDHPPRYLRAQLYDYRFSTRAERDAGRGLWRREPIGGYFGPTRLPFAPER
jgi:predicted DCC family thiol-disulfide oxidoreductase YuxK